MGTRTCFRRRPGFSGANRLIGRWRTTDADFLANEWGYEFTEGNPWHYCAAAPCDPQGLANFYGGRLEFSDKLDSVFAASRDYNTGSYGQVIHEMREAYAVDLGQYAHPNEPVHSLIYMYDYANAPSETQRRVRDVLDRLYDSGIGTGRGYLGDEDNGQMSAWYLFRRLGLLPSVARPCGVCIGVAAVQESGNSPGKRQSVCRERSREQPR